MRTPGHRTALAEALLSVASEEYRCDGQKAPRQRDGAQAERATGGAACHAIVRRSPELEEAISREEWLTLREPGTPTAASSLP